MPRFHLPLIEPDVRISRIRLSDKASCVRTRALARRPSLRAGLVSRAETWRFGSLWRRQNPEANDVVQLGRSPVAWPKDWVRLVNLAQSEAEQEAIRRCMARGQPYGAEAWTKRTATRFGLSSTLRPRGRPKKTSKNGS